MHNDYTYWINFTFYIGPNKIGPYGFNTGIKPDPIDTWKDLNTW